MLEYKEDEPLMATTDYSPVAKRNASTDVSRRRLTLVSGNPIAMHRTETKKKKPFSREQKTLFLCIALSNLFQYISWSILAPFFPTEAAKLEATPTQVGLIFGIYSLVQFIAAPILGKYLPVIGARFMYISGYFVTAGCNILFGFLDLLEPGVQFVTFCCVIRSVEAIGTAAVMTAGMSMIASKFPDSIGQAMFNLSPVEVGLVFLLMGVAYGLSAPFFGYLSDKYKMSRVLIIIGYFISCLGYLIIGPWAPLHIPHNIWTICIGIILINIAFGCALTPTYQDFLTSAVFNGMPDDMSTYSVVSGMFNCAYALGSFFGPTVGGALVQIYDFSTSASIFGFLNLTVAVSVAIFSGWEFNCGKGRRKTMYFSRFKVQTAVTADERTRLLSDQ